MNPIQKRKALQRLRTSTAEQFWTWMNVLHNRAYELGKKHMREAMECHPRISKRMVGEVEQKAVEICQVWDGLREVNVDETEIEVIEGRRAAYEANKKAGQ